MSENGSAELAELAELLAQLNAHGNSRTAGAPSPTEAMAMYLVASRLVELQLADRGECDDSELAVTREVLVGTHRMLNAALGSTTLTAPSTRRPALKVVPGGRPARRRPRGRYPS